MLGPSHKDQLDCHPLNLLSSQLRKISSANPDATSEAPLRAELSEAKSRVRSVALWLRGALTGRGSTQPARQQDALSLELHSVDPLTPVPRRERPFRGLFNPLAPL